MHKIQKKCSIVIVNWNGLRFLQDCLSAVLDQSYTNFDVYFVDNGSLDHSIDFVEKNFPVIKIVALPSNTGFAGGTNRGIEAALKDEAVEFVVCLNNDTIVDHRWLEAMVDAVDYEKKFDMVSSKSLFSGGTVQAIGLRFEKDLMGNRVGGLAIGYGQSPEKYTAPQEVFCPCGVSALYSRRLLEEVGLFDEDFFAYCEDLDLGIRARNRGYRCMYAPDSKLTHLHSQTSGGAASPFKAYLIKRNNYFVILKNSNLIDVILYPVRDFIWNVNGYFDRDTHKSSNKLIMKIGFLGTVKIMLRVYRDVIRGFLRILVKRFSAKKY